MRRTLATAVIVLLAVLFLPTTPAQATEGVCTVTAGRPRVINETVMYGAAQQFCAGEFGRQCVKARIQQREQDGHWYTKRASDWECSYGTHIWNSTGRVCDTKQWTLWRVKASGLMLWGQLHGSDWSYVQWLPCRMYWW